MTIPGNCCSVIIAGLVFCTMTYAQDDDEISLGGRPIECVIVNRDTYVKLLAETRFTEDETDLISEDVNYSRFPSRMYDAQMSFGGISNFKIVSGYSSWENDQGLDVTRKSVSLRVPLTDKWSVYPRYQRQTEEIAVKDYYYLSLGGWLWNVYSYSQLKYSSDQDDNTGSGIYEYLSWQPKDSSLRLGMSGSIDTVEDKGDIQSWYGKGFASMPVVGKSTSLHLSAMHLDYIDQLQYNEYEANVYQIVGTASSLRFGYRYYLDSEDLSSHSYGIKAKHYFHPRLGVHAGYRRYNHSEGADLNTFFGGFNLLL